EAAPGLELILQTSEPGDRPVARLAVQSLDLAARLLDPTEHASDLASCQDPLERGDVGPLEVGRVGLLREVTEIAGARDASGGRCGVADQGPDQAGLAGAVAPYEADLVAWLHAERDPVHESDGADVDSQVFDDDHGITRLFGHPCDRGRISRHPASPAVQRA